MESISGQPIPLHMVLDQNEVPSESLPDLNNAQGDFDHCNQRLELIIPNIDDTSPDEMSSIHLLILSFTILNSFVY